MITPVSLDWLQVFGVYDAEHLPFSSMFHVKHEDYVTKLFERRAVVENEVGSTLAEILYRPRNPMLKRNSALLKMENNTLYGANPIGLLNKIMNDVCFHMTSITRLDLCVDFTRICGMKPQVFIRSILDGEITVRSRKRVMLNEHRKFDVVSAGSVFYDTVTSNFTPVEVSGLRFGSRSSSICAYIYDKARELREVSDKPYIRNRWGGEINVWRLEFSIRGKYFPFMNLTTPINVMWGYLCDKYFSVFDNLGERLKLFPTEMEFEVDGSKVSDFAEVKRNRSGGRSERIFLRRLLYELNQYDINGGSDDVVDGVTEFAKVFAKEHHLEDFMIATICTLGNLQYSTNVDAIK